MLFEASRSALAPAPVPLRVGHSLQWSQPGRSTEPVAIFFNSGTGRTMFSAGRLSPVGLVTATLIDFRWGSAHRTCVANKADSAAHFHTALLFFICMRKSLSNFRNSRAPTVSTEAEAFLAIRKFSEATAPAVRGPADPC